MSESNSSMIDQSSGQSTSVSPHSVRCFLNCPAELLSCSYSTWLLPGMGTERAAVWDESTIFRAGVDPDRILLSDKNCFHPPHTNAITPISADQQKLHDEHLRTPMIQVHGFYS